MTCSTPSGFRDILSKPLLAFFLFWLPAIAIGVTGGSHFRGMVRVAVWTVALLVMGISCVVTLLDAAACTVTLPGRFSWQWRSSLCCMDGESCRWETAVGLFLA